MGTLRMETLRMLTGVCLRMLIGGVSGVYQDSLLKQTNIQPYFFISEVLGMVDVGDEQLPGFSRMWDEVKILSYII